MAIAVNTHKYKEAVSIDLIFVKEGEVKLLWGLVSFPKGKYIDHKRFLGICKQCGQMQFSSIHGYFKLEKN